MAKKTIQDLRINDSVFLCYGDSCEELKIETLSTSLLITSGRKNVTVELSKGDLTSWVVRVKVYGSEFNLYLSEIDCLLEVRKELDKQMKQIFKRQEDFFKSITNKNEQIREVDSQISLKLKNKK